MAKKKCTLDANPNKIELSDYKLNAISIANQKHLTLDRRFVYLLLYLKTSFIKIESFYSKRLVL